MPSHDPPANDSDREALQVGDDDFAPEELAMLRDFFRDEAQEALERLTGRLLGVAGAHPSAETITELMRVTHTLKGSAGTVGLQEIVDYAHELEDHFARIRDGRIGWSASVLDQFVEVVDAIRAYVDAIGTATSQSLLVERVEQHFLALRVLGTRRPPTPPPSPEREPPRADEHTPSANDLDAADGVPDVSDGTVVPYESEDDSTRSITAGFITDETPRDARGVLRVDPARIDLLMDGVGELVFDRTRIERRIKTMSGLTSTLDGLVHRLSARAGSVTEPDAQSDGLQSELRAIAADLAECSTQMQRATAGLLDDADALRRTTADLQTGLTRVRMSSAKSLFQTLSRQLRTIARSAAKKVRLTTIGADTEFDKIVAVRITDPLIQLLRNAVAHGIEKESVRVAAGKSPQGEIRIEARQEGRLVVIEVSDDGHGIDPDALRRRFVAAGRWSATKAELASDEDVLHALFDAGVSTRDEADQLAGRGVGLDTVRETIARLGGEVRMTSTPGRGTRFTIRLPVSMAISHALLFTVYRDVYAVPYVHVIETVQVERDGDDVPPYLHGRSGRIPVIHLQEVLESDSPVEMPLMPAIIIEYAGRRLALTCDKVMGPREIVVKELGPLLSPLPLYAGATIGSSGKVQLILDPAVLARLAYSDSQPIPIPSAAPVSELSMEDSQAVDCGRALIADDSHAIREAMTSILSSAGYIVDVAEDGNEAWVMISALRYDLLITDLEMPNLDGFGLIERIRRDVRLSLIPIIVMSSRDDEANRERAHQLAVAQFVAKPLTRKKIFNALKAI